jgi:hypothetical protein
MIVGDDASDRTDVAGDERDSEGRRNRAVEIDASTARKREKPG